MWHNFENISFYFSICYVLGGMQWFTELKNYFTNALFLGNIIHFIKYWEKYIVHITNTIFDTLTEAIFLNFAPSNISFDVGAISQHMLRCNNLIYDLSQLQVTGPKIGGLTCPRKEITPCIVRIDLLLLKKTHM